MKILHLLPYVPTPTNFGGALRIYHILEHLHANHDVTVAGFANTGDPGQFEQEFPDLKHKTHFLTRPWKKRFRRLVQLYSLFTGHSYWYTTVSSAQMQRKLDELIAGNDFDIIQSEFPSMSFFDLSNSDAVKVLDAHNVEYDNYRRMANMESSGMRRFFYQQEYKKLRREEIGVCYNQDAVFTTSERDKSLLDEDVPEVPKYVIPNGVDLSYFHPSETEPEPHSLVFTGMMGYVPNYEGMLFFLDEIFPLIKQKIPGIKIYIVGKQPPKVLKERASEEVIVTGFVEDVRPYVWRSSVYVVPLTMGGGTRLKVLEALAMKKPVVTTSIGSEGINVKDKESVLKEDDPEAFAEAVVRLIQERNLRNKLVKNGYELVKTTYDWAVIGNHIEDAYAQILKADSDNKEPAKRLEEV